METQAKIIKKAVCIAGKTAKNEPNVNNYNSLPRESQGWFTNLLQQAIESTTDKKQFTKATFLHNLISEAKYEH